MHRKFCGKNTAFPPQNQFLGFKYHFYRLFLLPFLFVLLQPLPINLHYFHRLKPYQNILQRCQILQLSYRVLLSNNLFVAFLLLPRLIISRNKPVVILTGSATGTLVVGSACSKPFLYVSYIQMFLFSFIRFCNFAIRFISSSKLKGLSNIIACFIVS